MPRKPQSRDRQPGQLPDITLADGCVIYAFPPRAPADQAQLVIRCDPQGELWVSIARRPREIA